MPSAAMIITVGRTDFDIDGEAMIPQFRMAVIAAVLGVVIIAGGAVLSTTTTTDCDGRRMSTGDVCLVRRDDGSVVRQSYEERRDGEHTMLAVLYGGLGLAFVALAGGQVALGLRRRRERAAATRATREFMALPVPVPPVDHEPAGNPPDGVLQAAYAANLGGYAGSMQPSRRSRELLTWGGFSVVFIVFTILGWTSDGWADRRTQLVAGITALPVIVFLLLLRRSPLVSAKARQLGFHLFDEGLVHATGAGLQAYPWDAIDTVYQSITRRESGGVPMGTAHSYLVEFNDGRRLTLNNFSADMKVLGPFLQSQVARVQVPRALRHLDSGHAIPFGPFTVNSAGVSRGGRGATWSEIACVYIENGGVRLHRSGGKAVLGGRQIRDLPNYATFVCLVDNLATAQR
jgi:hypothetical protein